jgi:hypothetical protein
MVYRYTDLGKSNNLASWDRVFTRTLERSTRWGFGAKPMKNSRNQSHMDERLKDRRDYRETLIHRREDLERKISAVESEIKILREKKSA